MIPMLIKISILIQEIRTVDVVGKCQGGKMCAAEFFLETSEEKFLFWGGEKVLYFSVTGFWVPQRQTSNFLGGLFGFLVEHIK